MSLLEARWPGDAAVGRDLLARWAEPHRHYHTRAHLAFVLDVIDEHAELAEHLEAVRLAAWFHDAVYAPESGDNEERSADLARAALAGRNGKLADEVVRLVLLTRDHRAATGDRNGGLLCDADLAILASPPARYADYARAVRAEYSFVPEDAYRTGRRDVLQQLLDLPVLFRVVPARDSWTARAHTNLGLEIDRLADPTKPLDAS
jgi:predicted metal-dependent HD superfamily phosphohydrolase